MRIQKYYVKSMPVHCNTMVIQKQYLVNLFLCEVNFPFKTIIKENRLTSIYNLNSLLTHEKSI